MKTLSNSDIEIVAHFGVLFAEDRPLPELVQIAKLRVEVGSILEYWQLYHGNERAPESVRRLLELPKDAVITDVLARLRRPRVRLAQKT